jgi:hypothetical protein
LERQAFVADKKNHFDMMIDIAEEEYKIDIRKTLTEQSTILHKKNNKQCSPVMFGIDRQVYYRRIKEK